MPQPVLVIHGAGSPRQRDGRVYWQPMLASDLGADFRVHAPTMPDPDDPHYQPWADRIAELTKDTASPVLVGHSFGASVLLKWLAQPEPRPAFLGLFLVAAPFWTPSFPEYTLSEAELKRIPALTPVFLYHSEDDEVVGVDHLDQYARAMPRATVRRLAGRGHEFDHDSFPELAADIRATTTARR